MQYDLEFCKNFALTPKLQIIVLRLIVMNKTFFRYAALREPEFNLSNESVESAISYSETPYRSLQFGVQGACV